MLDESRNGNLYIHGSPAAGMQNSDVEVFAEARVNKHESSWSMAILLDCGAAP